VSPNVRPPKPHIAPQKYAQRMLSIGASCSTARRSFVLIEARTHGAMIQLKNPPTSQYTSHAHFLTPRYGT